MSTERLSQSYAEQEKLEARIAELEAVLEAARPFAGIETEWTVGKDNMPSAVPIGPKPEARGAPNDGPTVGDVRKLRKAIAGAGPADDG